MASRLYRSNPADHPPVSAHDADPIQRRLKYGRILPMEEERGFLRRLFRR